jgi:hypothetical protein
MPAVVVEAAAHFQAQAMNPAIAEAADAAAVDITAEHEASDTQLSSSCANQPCDVGLLSLLDSDEGEQVRYR